MRINNWSQLQPAISKAIERSVVDANEEMEETVKESIEEVVYDGYDPTWYERSYDLKESITSEIVSGAFGGVISKIYHDLDMITPYSDLFQHWSMVKDYDVSEYIPYIVHEMGSHNLWESQYEFTKPRPYMDMAETWIESNNLYGRAMQRALRKYGIESRI